MSNVRLVTGSARGLGRVISEAALDAGHRVVATARNPDQLRGLADRYGPRMLGSDAFTYARQAEQARIAEADKWKMISLYGFRRRGNWSRAARGLIKPSLTPSDMPATRV